MRTLFAYIDPTSGMITVQLIAASLAGGIVYFRGLIAKAIRRVTGSKDKAEPVDAAAKADSIE